MDDERESRDVAELQQIVLTSALAGEPLPGGATIMLPELAQIVARDRIYVLDENLSASIAHHNWPKPVQIVNRSWLAQPAASEGDVMYLSFAPVELHGDSAVVRLDVGIERSTGPTTLGGVVIEFQRTPNQWVANPPRTFAT
jgi:hypothetical protein